MSQNLRPQNERRTLTHAGAEVGDDNVTRSQNTADQSTPILRWTGPRKFSKIEYAAGVHPTKAQLRSREEFTVSDADASGTLEEGERTLALSADLQPVDGEEAIEDQPFPVVRVVNVTQGAEIEPESVDYPANEVVVAEADVADGDSVKVFPLIADGTLRYQARDQFEHRLGALDEWGTPLHVFGDHDQRKRDSEIHLVGRMSFRENEHLEVYVDSPEVVVWEDNDFPDRFVSKFQQRVDISV